MKQAADASCLAGVGVIEAHQHAALVLLRKVLVQQGCFGMPYVQVARGLRRESGDHLALFSILKPYLERPCLCSSIEVVVIMTLTADENIN